MEHVLRHFCQGRALLGMRDAFAHSPVDRRESLGLVPALWYQSPPSPAQFSIDPLLTRDAASGHLQLQDLCRSLNDPEPCHEAHTW